jgi:hypothetical protein
MIRLAHFSMCACAFVGLALPLAGDSGRQPPAAEAAGQNSPARSCAAKAAGSYGFQCHGSAAPAGVLEPITFIGTVKGTEDGFYEGYGTFNSSAGTLSVHNAGQATFGRSCFGHVDYTTNEILLPGGGIAPLPPISFDFIAVDDGDEILGTGVANPADATGDLVPRITCRLVRRGR